MNPGLREVERGRPREENFEVIADVRGRAFLLLDDTFTSGTHAQAAASALQEAGGDVVAVVPIGRFMNPGYDEATQALWDSVKDIPFDFGDCCLHQR